MAVFTSWNSAALLMKNQVFHLHVAKRSTKPFAISALKTAHSITTATLLNILSAANIVSPGLNIKLHEF